MGAALIGLALNLLLLTAGGPLYVLCTQQEFLDGAGADHLLLCLAGPLVASVLFLRLLPPKPCGVPLWLCLRNGAFLVYTPLLCALVVAHWSLSVALMLVMVPPLMFARPPPSVYFDRGVALKCFNLWVLETRQSDSLLWPLTLTSFFLKPNRTLPPRAEVQKKHDEVRESMSKRCYSPQMPWATGVSGVAFSRSGAGVSFLPFSTSALCRRGRCRPRRR